LERLNEAITAVADVDVETLGEDDLDELVNGLQRARHRLAGKTAGPLAPDVGHRRRVGCRAGALS
jgi:hypothetical protein